MLWFSWVLWHFNHCRLFNAKSSLYTYYIHFIFYILGKVGDCSWGWPEGSLSYDGEAPVMLELWGMQSTPSLPLLPGILWPTVVAPDRVLSMGQIELVDIWTECKQMIYAK